MAPLYDCARILVDIIRRYGRHVYGRVVGRLDELPVLGRVTVEVENCVLM